MSMTEDQAKKLGELISRARSKQGYSVRRLAEQLGLSFSWLAKLEAGKYRDPAPERLARLVQGLAISPAKIDRLTSGALSSGLPEARTYFRSKYDLTPDQTAQVESYIQRLRRKQP